MTGFLFVKGKEYINPLSAISIGTPPLYSIVIYAKIDRVSVGVG